MKRKWKLKTKYNILFFHIRCFMVIWIWNLLILYFITLAKRAKLKREQPKTVACPFKWPKKQSTCSLNVICVFNWIFQVNVWCGCMNACTNCICYVSLLHTYLFRYNVHINIHEENKRIIEFTISRVVSEWESSNVCTIVCIMYRINTERRLNMLFIVVTVSTSPVTHIA